MKTKVVAVESPLVGNLLTLAKTLAKARDCTLATISRMAHGDPRSFDNLAAGEGGSISLRKYDSSMAWFAENWPTDLAWPDIQVPTFRKRKS